MRSPARVPPQGCAPCGKKPSDSARAGLFLESARAPPPWFYRPSLRTKGGVPLSFGSRRELTRVAVRTRAARTDVHGRLACASRVTGGDSSASNSLKKQKSALFPIQKSRPKFTKYLRALVKGVQRKPISPSGKPDPTWSITQRRWAHDGFRKLDVLPMINRKIARCGVTCTKNIRVDISRGVTRFARNARRESDFVFAKRPAAGNGEMGYGKSSGRAKNAGSRRVVPGSFDVHLAFGFSNSNSSKVSSVPTPTQSDPS